MNPKSIFLILSLLFVESFLQAQNSKELASLSQLVLAVSNAQAGNELVLSEGEFSGENIVLSGKGTREKPLLIKAKTPGKTIITSSLKIQADFFSVEGITFLENGNLEILGKGCRITNCKWDDSKAGKWIKVLPGSSEIEIDHNTFQNKIFSNTNMDRNCQLLQIIVRNENEKHHIHHNLFKNVEKGKTGNGFETLQLITENNPFDPPAGHCNSLIEHNLFEKCNGEAEIVSIKSNGNIIRKNTFRACKGGLVLRHGDENVVTQNYLFGKSEKGSAGVRIQGSGQIVANNYCQDLDNYGLGMMDGTPDDLYIRVENAQILFNTFVNCQNNFVIGINHSKHPNGTTPKNCLIQGNIFFSDENGSYESFIDFVQNDEPENWTWNGNIAFGKVTPHLEGIEMIYPYLLKMKFYKPRDKTPTTEIIDIPELVGEDLFGKKWELKRTVGAIQFPFDEKNNLPLEEKMVGAGF